MAEQGIAVNSASQISAAKWVDIFRRSSHLPSFLQRGIGARGNLIVGWSKITQPENTIPRDWLADLAAAFASGDWEITTAEETFELEKHAGVFKVRRKIYPDLGKGEFGPGYWFTTGPNQKEWSPDRYSFDKTYELGSAAIEYGETFSNENVNRHAKKGEGSAETRLKSGRALIIIINRMSVYGVHMGSALGSQFLPEVLLYFASAERIPIAEPTLVYSFLHELAAHGGRMNAGKSALHGDDQVEHIVRDILEMFPKDVVAAHTNQVSDALAQAARNLQPTSPGVTPAAHGRIPGPVNGPSGSARVPGPIR
ncbi:MAG: hypothetical protein IPL03_01175 [Sterolibacteriaceae bacterium]|nr:hypothetical protein [Candidatus Methylophosphatis haderslevensis]